MRKELTDLQADLANVEKLAPDYRGAATRNVINGVIQSMLDTLPADPEEQPAPVSEAA